MNYKALQKVIHKDLVDGLIIKSNKQPDPICEPCLAGKQHRGPIPKSAYHAYQSLELIHSDVHGPMAVSSREGGFRYWVSFIDDATRLWTIIPIRQKSDVFSAFQRFKSYAEN